MTAALPPQANCVGLPPEVIDKYFMAEMPYERFQYLTALRMCGRCAVQADCLTEAITQPANAAGIRGGESAHAVTDLRRRFKRGEDTARNLALNAIAHQAARVTIETSPKLRSGNFADVPLIRPRPTRRGGKL